MSRQGVRRYPPHAFPLQSGSAPGEPLVLPRAWTRIRSHTVVERVDEKGGALTGTDVVAVDRGTHREAEGDQHGKRKKERSTAAPGSAPGAARAAVARRRPARPRGRRGAGAGSIGRHHPEGVQRPPEPPRSTGKAWRLIDAEYKFMIKWTAPAIHRPVSPDCDPFARRPGERAARRRARPFVTTPTPAPAIALHPHRPAWARSTGAQADLNRACRSPSPRASTSSPSRRTGTNWTRALCGHRAAARLNVRMPLPCPLSIIHRL